MLNNTVKIASMFQGTTVELVAIIYETKLNLPDHYNTQL